MSPLTTKTPRVVELADRIEADIRSRGLRAGQPYLSTEDTVRMLQANTNVVHRALRLLVHRGLLERKQRKGTFVKDPALTSAKPALRRVHLLVHRNYLKTEGLLADGMVVGMQAELAAAELQFNFMPGEGEESYVRGLLDEAASSPYPEGFVLMRSPLAVQRLVAQSGVPAVVAGSIYASVPAMPWIDADNWTAGRLLAQRVLKAGHQAVLALVRDRVLAGDYPFLDGVRDALAQAGAGVEALTMRHLPADPEMIREEVRCVLQQSESLPGVVARSEPLADGAAAAVESLGLTVGGDVTITLSDWYRRHGASLPRYPFIREALTAEEQGRHIARLLVRRALAQGSAADHETIPVTVEEPRTPRASKSNVL
jgi:DNA-binding LacI/PurR family transcriptional regulator/DNA-binding transcriptional regulator YhcF (GntR family)